MEGNGSPVFISDDVLCHNDRIAALGNRIAGIHRHELPRPELLLRPQPPDRKTP